MRIQRQKDRETLEDLRTKLPGYVSDFIQISLDTLTSTTVLSYATDIKDFLEWMYISLVPHRKGIKDIRLEDLEKLKDLDISNYRNELRDRPDSHNIGKRYYKTSNKEVTINRKISALKKFFTFLSKGMNPETDSKYLSRNVMENVGIKKEKIEPKAKAEKMKSQILRKDELEEFQRFIIEGYGEKDISTMKRAYWRINRYRDAAIISLLVGSGMRVGELVSLRLKDVNMIERNIIVDRKRSTTDVIFFPVTTKEYLEEYLIVRKQYYKAGDHNNDPFFVSKYNNRVNPISKNTVQKMVMKYADEYGKKLTAHKLRHSFGTYLFNKTKNIRGVQKALGHSSLETVQIYTHMFEDDDRALIDEAFKSHSE